MAVKINYELIKEKRNELGLSQQDLAEQSGINVNTLKTIETGRANTTYENALKIAEVLDLFVDDIYIKDYKDTKVIAIANNKGGCGKTSVVSNLGYALSEMGYKILLIDSDMQMNLTYSYGHERNMEKNLYNAIIEETKEIDKYILDTKYNNIDMIISDFSLAAIESVLFTKAFRESIFKVMLDPLINKGIYDFIIIDTNPTLGIFNYNILNASHYVIVPVELSAFGILGLDILTKFIDDVKRANTELKLLGVVRTKVDNRENITKEADSVLIDVFGDNLFDTSIPIDTNIKRAQWKREPLTNKTRAKKAYQELAREVINLVR